jgi:hypothetical protein
MPRSLTFQFRNAQFEAELIKIDRSKIYGTVEVVTNDHEGAETTLMSLARDGRTLIGYGGTGAGYINKDPIRLAYHLGAEGLPDSLAEKLTAGDIYRFDFSYRGGPVADPAFLMTDLDGDLWLLIGNTSEVAFRDFKQVALCAAAQTDEVEDDSEDDNFDFDML